MTRMHLLNHYLLNLKCILNSIFLCHRHSTAPPLSFKSTQVCSDHFVEPLSKKFQPSFNTRHLQVNAVVFLTCQFNIHFHHISGISLRSTKYLVAYILYIATLTLTNLAGIFLGLFNLTTSCTKMHNASTQLCFSCSSPWPGYSKNMAAQPGVLSKLFTKSFPSKMYISLVSKIQ